ncbi:DUF4232 domain-containing protein [Streptomyces sp. B21-108]|jgi:hypothetical protein|uniref:DUF4232 domain-containing protein n=1 Tax=Streptomyces sp. B21-108 TaxID=3039419 RepID=UPI002FF0AD21
MINISTRIAALATTALLAATGTMAGAAPSSASPRIPTCHVADLHLSVGKVTGGAGSLFYPLRFTNTSTHTCSLRGYPGVSVLNSHRHQIGAPATRNAHPVSTVFVHPARTVFATIRTNNPSVVPTCRPTSTYIRVYPPASFQSVLIRYHLKVCGAFEINPVQRTA